MKKFWYEKCLPFLKNYGSEIIIGTVGLAIGGLASNSSEKPLSDTEAYTVYNKGYADAIRRMNKNN